MFSLGKTTHHVFVKHYVNTMVATKYKKLFKHKGPNQVCTDRGVIGKGIIRWVWMPKMKSRALQFLRHSED